MAIFASASSSSSSQVKYDVFISFRGPEVRYGFLSHLKKELRREKVYFYVDEMLERGDEITPALERAIKGSMIALVIFSKDYASSEWCLQELVKIMECKKADQQIVIPVFLFVDPSTVRQQKGTYADAFEHHEQKFRDKRDNFQVFKDNMEKLKIWRSVLKRTADLSGHHLQPSEDESEFIDAIVKDILKKLKDDPSVPKSQLGASCENIDSVKSLMEITRLQEVRFLGIWGMGGIGKTFLAREIFKRFHSQFDSSCFLKLKKKKKSTGWHKKLLHELLGDKDLHKNMNAATRMLQRVKALIVLDDVDGSNQLEGKIPELGQGSRVIVTSRDKRILRSLRIDEKYIHEVKSLRFHESFELFSSIAFHASHSRVGYTELSTMIVQLADGNPLALNVFGRHFYGKGEAYWKSELDKFKTCLHRTIQDSLKVSYDGLDDMDKEIFLSIAFSYVGEEKDRVIGKLGLNAVSGIENLMDKALIKIDPVGKIEVHVLIQGMAEQIDPERHKRTMAGQIDPKRRRETW